MLTKSYSSFLGKRLFQLKESFRMPKILTKQRVQFDFTPEALERLDRLEERIGASTRAEVIRNALKLYDWFVNQIKPDYVIEIKNEANEVVFKIPAKVLMS